MNKDWEQAILTGNADQVHTLLDAGVDIDCLDRYGQTALMQAAHKGHVPIVRILLQRGAKLDHTAKFGLSALMLAVISDQPEIVRLLLSAGANTDIRGSSRSGPYACTALELAEQMGRRECVQILKHKTVQ
jgi:ankyrin repeat protein